MRTCGGLLLALLVATASARADEAPPRIVLEHAGEDPRSPLRLQPRAGASALYTVHVEQKLSEELAGGPPALGAWFQSEVRRVDPDGSAEVLTWLAGISNVRPDRDEVRQAFAHLLGLEVRARLDARGGASRASLGLRGQPIARPPAQVGTLLGALSRNAVPLPEEAVGVGARWTVDDTTELMGARVRRHVTYKLAAREADRVELDVELSLAAEDVDLTGPRGGTQRVKRLKGEGSSRINLQLTGMPLGELDLTLQLEVEAEGRWRAEPAELTVRTRVARAQEAFAFVRWKDGAPEPLRCPEGTSPEEVLHDGPEPEPEGMGWRCIRPDGTPHGPSLGVGLTGIRTFEGEYRDGQRSGTWKVWPHPRSEALVSTWREGRLDGLNEQRDPETGGLERGEWRNGLKEGPFEVLDSRGVSAGRGTYVRGEREGTWTWQHPGSRVEVEYRGGKRHGLQVERDASGKEGVRGTWKEGRKDGEWVFLKGGRVVERRVYRQGKLWTGEQTLKLPQDERDGKLAEGLLREGKRQGPWTEWDTDYRANPRAMGRYVDGKREGRWRTWHSRTMGTRVLASEGDWRRDVKDGRWTYFNEEGRRVREETWSGGKLDGPFTLFHASGRKQEAGRYRNGLKDGEWARWDDEGELQWKGRFTAGRPVGPWSVRQGHSGMKTVLAGPGAQCPPWTSLVAPPTDGQPLAGCRNLETGALEGFFTRLHETYGYAAESGSFAQNLKDGAWTLYYPSGNVLARGAYRAGFKDGPWTYFHDAKDRVLAEAAYTAGLRSGVWRAFHADGRPWMETRYLNGTEAPSEAYFKHLAPEGRAPVARQAPHALLTGRGDFPQEWLAPGESSLQEFPVEALHRELFPDGRPRTEELWRHRRHAGMRRTWNEQGVELTAVDPGAEATRATKGTGGPRQERVRQVDAKTFLERSWDGQGRLLWVARTGARGSLQGPVTVWDESGKPRWYLGVSRGVLQGPFRLPGPPGQPDVTGHALLNELIELKPGLCPPGTRLGVELEDGLELSCEDEDRDAVLSFEWDAGLTLRHWARNPKAARAEAEAREDEDSPERAKPDAVSRYPDGRPRWEKVPQAQGLQRYRAWYPDGKLMEEGTFQKSWLEGLWQGFAPDGTRLWEGRFHRGRPTGVWEVWHEDGSRRARYGFEGWRFARFWRRDGSLWKEMEVGPGASAQLWRWFSPEGRLVAEGALSKGAPVGPWRLDLDGDGTFESRSHTEYQPLRWRVDSGDTRLEVLTAGDGNTGTWRLSDALGPRDVSLREGGQVRKRWTRDAAGVLVAVPEPDYTAHAPEPPPWQSHVDEEAAPFLPDDLATERATP